MTYYNLKTKQQQDHEDEDTILTADERLNSFFNPPEEPYRVEYIDNIPTCVLIPPPPAKTAEEIEQEQKDIKWHAYNLYRNKTISPWTNPDTGHKFDITTQAADEMLKAELTMNTDKAKPWHEDWGSFLVTKLELTEVLAERERLLDEKNIEIFGEIA